MTAAPLFVLHRGFDALLVAVQALPPPPLAEALEAARLAALQAGQDEILDFGGRRLRVGPGGARGGFSYRAVDCATDMTWLFKRPTVRDPWCVFVEVQSRSLCRRTYGIAKAEIVATLAALGVAAPPSAFAVNRIDFAIDILAPGFVLVPSAFVCPSRTLKAANESAEREWHARADRVHAVRIGKSPYRQAVIYDKRKEVLDEGKVHWWRIWDDALAAAGRPPLAARDAEQAPIWRVELRLCKRHLKDDWNIVGFAELERLAQAAFEALAADYRLTEPSGTDGKRDRWPDHALWRRVRAELGRPLFDGAPPMDEAAYRELTRDQMARVIVRQSTGLAASLAAIRGEKGDDQAVLDTMTEAMRRDVRAEPDRFAETRARAAKRYPEAAPSPFNPPSRPPR